MAVILLVVIINALIAYIQERKAINSLNSLKTMLSQNSTILEKGEKRIAPSSLVPEV